MLKRPRALRVVARICGRTVCIHPGCRKWRRARDAGVIREDVSSTKKRTPSFGGST